jgi:hypothetical protein
MLISDSSTLEIQNIGFENLRIFLDILLKIRDFIKVI